MFRKALLGLAMIAALGGSAYAQENKAALTAATNAAIAPNGVGAITANVLNTLINTIIPSTGTLLDNNAWSLTQTFSVAPVFDGLTGYMYAHSGGVPTASTTVPWSAISSTPTTVSGYGITALPWADVTGTPTTVSGYGITALPWADVTGAPTTIAGYGITVLPWANVTGTPSTFSGYGITSGPASDITFLQNGTGAVATNLNTVNYNRVLYATDYMTPAQIADGTSRTDNLDVSGALIACAVQSQIAVKNCYVPAGKWRWHPVSPTGPWTFDNNSGNAVNNAPFLLGDGGATVVDMSSDTTYGYLLFTASGGTGTGALAQSTAYGGEQGITLICDVTGPCVQDGLDDFYDAMNQQTFIDDSVQNLNTGNSSIAYQFNSVYSPYIASVNGSSAAGPNGGNDLFQFRDTSFGTFNTLGGSNGQTFIHITSGTNAGDVFNGIDCEVVKTCVAQDTASGDHIQFNGGTWSYNWGSTGANAVSASAGSNLAIFYPNQNPNATTGAPGSFLSSGSAPYANMWDRSTIAPLASPTFTGTVTAPNLILTGLVTGTPVYYLCSDAGGHVIISSGPC